MPELVVDGRAVAVRDGATLLEAARSLGVAIPTLCFHEGLPHHASCMVCLVEDERSGRLAPACATRASEGDRVRTEGERVLAARRRSVEMLLAEHEGDCEAPCTRACPARADIPAALRRFASGDRLSALAALMDRLPLAGTLAAICPAPCRASCRRRLLDSAVDICAVQRAAAEAGLAGTDPYTPPALPASGKSVAVVGAGPAGLSAAYFLALDGHRCAVFEGRDRPGGSMPVPAETFEADIGVLRRLGVQFTFGRAVAIDRDIVPLKAQHDAVVLATGSRMGIAERLPDIAGLPGVFVCGNAALAQPTRLAVRSIADGRRAAREVGSFLTGRPAGSEPRRFDSRRGALSAEDLVLLARRAAAKTERSAGRGPSSAAPDPAAAEALRCLDCDCWRKESCRLRRLADELGADARRFALPQERRIELFAARTGLSLEPGKCIRCGICVRIAEAGGDRPGLSFSGRGPDVRVRVPFGDDLGRALPTTASECVTACPTGALAWDPAARTGAGE